MAEPPERAMTHHEATIKRVIDAPRELVWQAWTRPEQVTRWWGPHGVTTQLSTIEMDVRPGGVFRLTMVSDADGAEYPSEMVFREVVKPVRLVFAWEPQRGLGSAVVTVTFEELGEKTEITLHWSGYARAELFPEIRTGWAEQMERLAGICRTTPTKEKP